MNGVVHRCVGHGKDSCRRAPCSGHRRGPDVRPASRLRSPSIEICFCTTGRGQLEPEFRPVDGDFGPLNGIDGPVDGDFGPLNGIDGPVDGSFGPVGGGGRVLEVRFYWLCRPPPSGRSGGGP
jgi:hypothetical protein